jgi:hypothetical protein
MATIRTPAATWKARNAKLFMVSPATKVTFGASTTLSGSFAAVADAYELSAMCKNVTISAPETPYDLATYLGVDSNGFQNQTLDEKPVGTASITGTMIVDTDEGIEFILSGAFVSAPAGYSRYNMGQSNTSNNTVAVCLAVETPDSTKYYAVAFDTAKFAKWGDLKLSSDGVFEQDFQITNLAKNFRFEFKN